MATLIAVYNSQGRVRRCDARCYNAQQPRCECICGGVNHAAGLATARLNTAALAEDRIKANCLPDKADKLLRVVKAQQQAELFGQAAGGPGDR